MTPTLNGTRRCNHTLPAADQGGLARRLGALGMRTALAKINFSAIQGAFPTVAKIPGWHRPRIEAASPMRIRSSQALDACLVGGDVEAAALLDRPLHLQQHHTGSTLFRASPSETPEEVIGAVVSLHEGRRCFKKVFVRCLTAQRSCLPRWRQRNVRASMWLASMPGYWHRR